MTRDEYVDELHGLIESFDEHVEGDDVALALQDLADRVAEEGLTS